MPRTVPGYTIANLDPSDFSQLVFRPHVDNTDPQNPVNTLIAVGYYKVKPSDPSIVPDQKMERVSVVCNSAQRTAIRNFISSNLIPAAHVQEGIV